MLVMNKLQTLLFPMDLKKYMLLTLATLWTVLLIIALITTLIHQAIYQRSGEQVYLEWEIQDLQADLEVANAKIIDLDLSLLDTETTNKRIIAEQQLEIAKGKETIKGLRDFYSYIIKPELLYYGDIPDE